MINFKGFPYTCLCPECDGELNVPEDCIVGEIVTCMDCGMTYEISSVEPVEIKQAETVAEDWGE
jgi:alpha-aminoadipate carrier protein LysW